MFSISVNGYSLQFLKPIIGCLIESCPQKSDVMLFGWTTGAAQRAFDDDLGPIALDRPGKTAS